MKVKYDFDSIVRESWAKKAFKRKPELAKIIAFLISWHKKTSEDTFTATDLLDVVSVTRKTILSFLYKLKTFGYIKIERGLNAGKGFEKYFSLTFNNNIPKILELQDIIAKILKLKEIKR